MEAGRTDMLAVKDQQLSSLEQQMEQLRQEIRTRNQRDQDICRRLKSGHSVIAKVAGQPMLPNSMVWRSRLPISDVLRKEVTLVWMQAVKDQRQAAQAALDMLPSVDLVHSSMIGTYDTPVKKREI